MNIYETEGFTKLQLEEFRKQFDLQLGYDLFEENETMENLTSVTCNYETLKEYHILCKIETEILGKY